MSDKANLWIIGDRFRRGHEHQHGARAHLFTSFLDEAVPMPWRWCDARTARSAKIADISKIAERARDAD